MAQIAAFPSPATLIQFTFQGRRTLSENLTPETIHVPLDIVHRSHYLSHKIQESPQRYIPLPSIDPAAFKIYIHWLATGHIPPSHSTNLQFQDCTDMLYAHILGNHFAEPRFQRNIMDTLAVTLDEAQVPDLAVLQIIFLEDGVDEGLARFVVERMFMHERRMLGMIRGEGRGLSFEERYEGNRNKPYRIAPDDGRVDSEKHKLVVEKVLPPIPSLGSSMSHRFEVQDDFEISIEPRIQPVDEQGITKMLVAECIKCYNMLSVSPTAIPSAANASTRPLPDRTPQSETRAVLQHFGPGLPMHDPLLHDSLRQNIDASFPSPTRVLSDLDSEQGVSAILQSTTSIKRKPASLRGLDWFEQYDRVNSNRL